MDVENAGKAITLISEVLNEVDFAGLSKYGYKHLSEIKRFIEQEYKEHADIDTLGKIKRKAKFANGNIITDDRLTKAVSIIEAIQYPPCEPMPNIVIDAKSLSCAKEILLKYVTSELFDILKTEYEQRSGNGTIIQKLTDTGMSYEDAGKYVNLACRIFRNVTDIDSDWYMYVGSNLTNTRKFCEYLTKKKYIHKSEIPGILKGNIDRHKCKINPETGLPYGLINGTNPQNFIIFCGGWNCGHQLVPMAAEAVPADIRKELNLV
ncbi:MAG: hypothetical protein LBS69_06035 [Prevotellaceae bacterium]|jgi:hypothetical protein|nr:hypothetical protein [Prevotellaceae bacterium]